MTLGHMPREVSKVSWFFLGHGGGISSEITGRTKRSAIPISLKLVYTFCDPKADQNSCETLSLLLGKTGFSKVSTTPKD